MKTGKCLAFLSVVLLAVLMMGLVPASYAEAPAYPYCCTDPHCACGCVAERERLRAQTAAPVLSASEPKTDPMKEQREQTLAACLFYAGEAEEETDPILRGELYAEAGRLWDLYMDMVLGYIDEPVYVEEPVSEPEIDEGKEQRVKTLAACLLYAGEAEEETDPILRNELYAEAERLWNAYMDMVIGAVEEPAPEIDELETQRQQTLEKFLAYVAVAEKEENPFVRDELYTKAFELWNQYMDMVNGDYDASVPEPEFDSVKVMREDTLARFLAFMMNAEEETDPYLREELYMQAEKLWDAYMEMVLNTTQNDIYLESAEPFPAGQDILADAYLQTPAAPVPAEEEKAAEAPLPAGEDIDEVNEFLTELLMPYLYVGIEENMTEMPQSAAEQAPEEAEPTAAPADTGLEAAPAKPEKPHHAKRQSPKPTFFGMPNPWTTTDWFDEAAWISGLETELPAQEALPQHMWLSHYRAMPGLMEADYTNGEEELTLRASLDGEGAALSGDYNQYSTMWTENIGGIAVDCLGDGERVNVATFKCGDTAYAMTMACGSEGEGLTPEEIGALLCSMGLACETEDAQPEQLPADADAVVSYSDILLLGVVPEAVDEIGAPVSPVRSGETNLGDFWADAYRAQGGADIGLVNSGGLQGNLGGGLITVEDIENSNPYDDTLCVAEMTGQQIVDALEWACRMLPRETGSFLQVSGLSFEVDTAVKSPCLADMDNRYVALMGERRVRNVKVNGEAIDPAAIYTVAASDYILLSGEDGNSVFAGAKLLKSGVKSDTQVLIDYLIDDCGGVIGSAYADQRGQGRIVLLGAEDEILAAEPAVEAEATAEAQAPEAESGAGEARRHFDCKTGMIVDKSAEEKPNAEPTPEAESTDTESGAAKPRHHFNGKTGKFTGKGTSIY